MEMEIDTFMQTEDIHSVDDIFAAVINVSDLPRQF